MEIRNFACVGAGLIGQGWATVFTSRGYPVVLQDISEDILDNAVARVGANLSLLEKNGLLAPKESELALQRIKTTRSMEEAVGHADYVQESVLDNYDLKRRVFKDMDALAKQRCFYHLFTELAKVDKLNHSPGWKAFRKTLARLLKDAVRLSTKKPQLAPQRFDRLKDRLAYRLEKIIEASHQDKDRQKARKKVETSQGRAFHFP